MIGVIESAVITYDDRIIDYSIGEAGSVEFNFFRPWNFIKTLGLNFIPEDLQFYHVHPPGMTTYSDKDLNCVQGWHTALECVIYFNIITFHEDDLFSVKHDVVGYWFDNTRCDTHGKLLLEKKVYPVRLTGDQLLFLKYLSYGGE